MSAALYVSSDNQLVIPKSFLSSLGLKPGSKLQVFEMSGRIELVPVGNIEDARGIVRGIDTRIERDPDRL